MDPVCNVNKWLRVLYENADTRQKLKKYTIKSTHKFVCLNDSEQQPFERLSISTAIKWTFRFQMIVENYDPNWMKYLFDSDLMVLSRKYMIFQYNER